MSLISREQCKRIAPDVGFMTMHSYQRRASSVLKAHEPPLPVATPRIEHFSGFFFLLLNFLCHWPTQRSSKALFSCNRDQNHTLLDPEGPKQRRFVPGCLI